MKIAMVASEAKPFCKTGGLADVVYSLSKELAEMGEEVTVFIPFYNTINTSPYDIKYVNSLIVTMSWRKNKADIYSTIVDGITFYLIKNDQYFSRGHLYGDGDDGERFTFFSLAVRLFIEKNKIIPSIVHVHDWQAGMLPVLFKNSRDIRFSRMKFVLTIHNPAFQGMLDREALYDLYNLPDNLYIDGSVRLDDRVSTLKSAIIYSDIITTVSPTHHLELLSPEGGMHLDGSLRLREWDFSGILNGIDYLEFNPLDDKFTAYPFNVINCISKKSDNKKSLFKDLHITNYGKPLFSMVTRLTWQKGFDITFPIIRGLLENGCNVVVLGSGENRYENKLEELRSQYPDKLAIYIGYNEVLAHRIYASSDFFLMPSLFEPCGLGQMIAQRYGALPIVRRTGGLKDSVIGFDGHNGESANGFGFDEYSEGAMWNTCQFALDCYENRTLFRKLVRNAMNTDNSWKKSAIQYLSLYKNLINK